MDFDRRIFGPLAGGSETYLRKTLDGGPGWRMQRHDSLLLHAGAPLFAVGARVRINRGRIMSKK